MMYTTVIVYALVAAVAAQTFTEFTPAQTSEIYSKLETLRATRPFVISVQDAVRSALPFDTFPNPEVGPFLQEDYASLGQDPTPVFTEYAWFPSLPSDLQAAYRTLEPPALEIERSIINEVVPITNGPSFPVVTTFVTSTSAPASY